jgi:hypothetical protein
MIKRILLTVTGLYLLTTTAKADGTLPFGDGTLPFDMAGTIVELDNNVPSLEQRLKISFQSRNPQSTSEKCLTSASRKHNIGGMVITSDNQNYRISSVCSSLAGNSREVLATKGAETLRLNGVLKDVGRYQNFSGTATIELNGYVKKQFNFEVQD